MVEFGIEAKQIIRGIQTPIRRIFRNPGYLGLRMVLAGFTIGGSVACEQSRGSEKLSCPTTVAEVSYLAGGNPENWKPVSDVQGAWVFRSEKEQVLTGARIGRVDTPHGKIYPPGHPSSEARTKEGWYVCPGLLDNIDLTPTPLPR